MKLFTPQPATTLYPLSRGWRIIAMTLRGHLGRTRTVAARWIDHSESLRYLASQYFWPLKYLTWIATAGLYAAALLQYIPAILLLFIFIVIYPVLLMLWLICSLVSLIILTVSTKLSKNLYGIVHHCPACYKEMVMPTYLCPTCQTEHSRLRPGIYGVLSRRCKICETLLPTLDRAGRKELTCICPFCHHTLTSDKSPGIHISLVGSSASGKTTFIAATMHVLKSGYVPQLQASFPDSKQEEAIMRKLHQPEDANLFSETSLSTAEVFLLKLQSKHFWFSRLLYLYDPVVFNSRQEYHAYSDGFIFVIDPFTLPIFYQKYQEKIQQIYPHCQPDHVGTEQMYAGMMQVFEAAARIRGKERYQQPVAVVVTKVDAVEHENKLLILSGENDTEHNQIRGFLSLYGLGNFVRDLEASFAHVSYFACSPLEDLKKEDEKEAHHLFSPLLWLLSYT